MMHGLEKSDLAIVAVKPANKGAQVARGVGGAKGGGQGKHGQTAHAVDSEPRIDVSQRTAHARSDEAARLTVVPSSTQGGSRMP